MEMDCWLLAAEPACARGGVVGVDRSADVETGRFRQLETRHDGFALTFTGKAGDSRSTQMAARPA